MPKNLISAILSLSIAIVLGTAVTDARAESEYEIVEGELEPFIESTTCSGSDCDFDDPFVMPGALLSCDSNGCVFDEEDKSFANKDDCSDCELDTKEDERVLSVSDQSCSENNCSTNKNVLSVVRSSIIKKAQYKLPTRVQPYMINSLHQLANGGQNPTISANRYWLSRVGDKNTLPEMFGAMVWHRIHGITH